MIAIATISLIFFAQCTYLHASPAAGQTFCDLTDKPIAMVLFTRKMPMGKNVGVQECCENINKTKPIVFMIHGFMSEANTTEYYKVAQKLIHKGYTVFSLDWSEAACTLVTYYTKVLQYERAVRNTDKIGEYAARYVQALVRDCNISLDNIIFIGHSLGAHVSGFAGKQVKKLGLGTLPLIIAADPAGPSFSERHCIHRLCQIDAKRIVAIHTSSILGITYDVGHLDLYFHYQKRQPGCNIFEDTAGTCSHTLAVTYIGSMLEDNCGFIGVTLPPPMIKPKFPDNDDPNCIFMNNKILDKDDTRKGAYYVFVGKEPPYCPSKPWSCAQ